MPHSLTAGPMILTANQPADRFYRGGAAIAAFRAGEFDPTFRAPDGDRSRVPEDWVASTTTLFGEPEAGLSTLPDGTLLRTAVQADPEFWLGPAHLAAYGPDTRLLVKLLDAGQRLPVHAHPDAEFATRHLGRTHGKAEAWHILSPGQVWLGLRRQVAADDLLQLVRTQQVERLLELLHVRDVGPGDTVFVPPGTLHAIGAGIFLTELQEPTDLSVLCEWRDFELDGPADGHLGLGFPTALASVDRRTLPDPDALITSGALPSAAAPFFRLERLRVESAITVDPGFAVLVVTTGRIGVTTGDRLELSAGSTAVLPWAAGPPVIDGAGELLICRPPHAPLRG